MQVAALQFIQVNPNVGAILGEKVAILMIHCSRFSGTVLIILLISLVVTTSPAKTNPLPFQSDSALTVYLDTASFRAGHGKAYQEFYYQIQTSELHFDSTVDGYRGEFETAVTLTDSSGQTLLQDAWTQPLMVEDQSQLAGRMLPNQFELTLDPGAYTMSLTVTDVLSGRRGGAQLQFRARAFLVEQLQISDVQLASEISSATQESKFSKNGLSVLPHPSGIFGSGLPLLYFYFEVYHLSATDSFEISYTIANEPGEVVRRLPGKIAAQQHESSVEVGGVNVASLKASSAVLRVEVLDRVTGSRAMAMKEFRNQAPLAATLPEIDPEIAALTEKQLQEHIQQIHYVLRQEDRQMLPELDSQAQRVYLSRFWRQLDPTPATPENEFRIEYFARVKYADDNFTAGFTKGWKTDRGRIIIRFGYPNEVERFPAQPGVPPYETWTYYQEGRKQFIFADIDGLGKYELIFSSDERELTRPDWRRIINAQ